MTDSETKPVRRLEVIPLDRLKTSVSSIKTPAVSNWHSAMANKADHDGVPQPVEVAPRLPPCQPKSAKKKRAKNKLERQRKKLNRRNK